MELNTKQNLSCNVVSGATGIHYFKDDETMEITTADKKLMTKIRHIAKDNDEVIIDQVPSIENGGFMLALMPVEYLAFHKHSKREITEEQRKILSERMKKARENISR